MLDHFLETRIRKKIRLCDLLIENKISDIKHLSRCCSLTETSTRDFLQELNSDFSGIAQIILGRNFADIEIYEGVSKNELFYAIYEQSIFLECLKFLLLNVNSPFTVFVDEYFLSIAQAYRIKQRCAYYLQMIGLTLNKNTVEGEEYRIRFLIALLEYRFGIHCYEFSRQEIDLAHSFILSINPLLTKDFLEKTTDEFGFFEYLCILSWKRRNYSPFTESPKELNKVKELFAYKKIKKHADLTIERTLNIKFTENDYDYLLLIYCCTHNCLFSDQWTEDDAAQVNELIFNNPKSTMLLDLFENNFERVGEQLVKDPILKTVIIYLYKKFLLDLQGIIPSRNPSFFVGKKEFEKSIFLKTKEVIYQWMLKKGSKRPIDHNQLIYLSMQIELILRQYIPPTKIMIVSASLPNIEIIKLTLYRVFSDKKIHIESILIGTDPLENLNNLRNSVILVNKKYQKLLNKYKLEKNNKLIITSIDLELYHINRINRALFYYEKKKINKMI
ncbi:MAG: helix-turn-helix domain-containing protein [Enterococcus lacertideformus]|uniref:Helix-turn-helix domain-containing protein n=1 Tax=Enterococcus lacertideformus TaxID=2771493 RepID=A0A931F823_9ENTE|nr:helix-turn-helix domain-containing protein [Enterococcus lacertideformus]